MLLLIWCLSAPTANSCALTQKLLQTGSESSVLLLNWPPPVDPVETADSMEPMNALRNGRDTTSASRLCRYK